jgi:hypothetical protein
MMPLLLLSIQQTTLLILLALMNPFPSMFVLDNLSLIGILLHTRMGIHMLPLHVVLMVFLLHMLLIVVLVLLLLLPRTR